MRKRRRESDSGARGADSRLVYSTGGEKLPDAATPPSGDEGVARTGVRISLERRASGRVVTVVTGLPAAREEAEVLARALKAACGTGGSVKDGLLELQGDHRSAVEAALRARGLRSKRAGGAPGDRGRR